jgi:hypothetical protein
MRLARTHGSAMRPPPRVMPGLVPGIHVLKQIKKDVDGRDEPGHDGGHFRSKYLCSPVSTSSPRWLCKVAVMITIPVVRWGTSSATVSCG